MASSSTAKKVKSVVPAARKRKQLDQLLNSMSSNELDACMSLSRLIYKTAKDKKQAIFDIGTLVRFNGLKTVYKVIECHKGMYGLESSNGTRVLGMFEHSQLEQVSKAKWKGKYVYVVEKILGDRVNSNEEREFLVKWRFYPDEDATWEPEKNFVDKNLIDDYFNKSINKEVIID